MTPVFSAALRTGDNVLLVTANDRSFTRTVRSQRSALAFVLARNVVKLLVEPGKDRLLGAMGRQP